MQFSLQTHKSQNACNIQLYFHHSKTKLNKTKQKKMQQLLQVFKRTTVEVRDSGTQNWGSASFKSNPFPTQNWPSGSGQTPGILLSYFPSFLHQTRGWEVLCLLSLGHWQAGHKRAQTK